MTNRENEILHTVTHRLRVLSLQQIGQHWWNGNVPATKLGLRGLVRVGFIELTRTLAQPLSSPTAPVLTWRLGTPIPNMGQVSYQLADRWNQPLRPTMIVNSTIKGAARMGGFGGRRCRASETSHDLGLAAVYLLFCSKVPGRAKGWQSEACLYDQGFGRHDRLPDAMIVTRAEKTIIEFGGTYSKAKLEGFHASCAARNLAYEIW